MNGGTLTIAAVERDTGISKDLLRVWERRYGFPSPQRDAAGERAYAQDQVARLRIVKRLLDAGHRPGRVLQLDAAGLQMLAASCADHAGAGTAAERAGQARALPAEQRQMLLALLRGHDLPALDTFLQRELARCGLEPFVLHCAPALNASVADGWMRGQLEAFEERAYRQRMMLQLQRAIAQIDDTAAGAAGPAPCVLLASFPGEPHDTDLLLAQALLQLHGCRCVPLGPQLALSDTAGAAIAYHADIAVLAFGGSLAPNAVVSGLAELRARLNADTALWAVGPTPVLQRRRVTGVQPLAALHRLPAALADWRQRSSRPPAVATDPVPPRGDPPLHQQAPPRAN